MKITFEASSIEELAEIQKLLNDLLRRSIANDAPLSDLPLQIRTRNCLLAERIETVGALCSKSAGELLTSPNLGRKSLGEIRDVLAVCGLALKGEP